MPQDFYKRKFLPPNGDGTQAGSDFYEVTISKGNTLSVGGQMKENFAFQLQAEYAKLMSGVIPFSELFKKLGYTQLTTGIFSRKYYTGGNHLQMNVDFRVFEDYSESGNSTDKNKSREHTYGSKIIKASRDLSRLMTADSNTIGKDTPSKTLKDINNQYESIKKSTGSVEIAKTSVKGLVSDIVDRMNKRTVSLKIGNFFKHNGMVMTSLDVSYSRELTRVGPLYADFKVSLESIEAMDNGKFGQPSEGGVLLDMKQKRITFDSGS